MQLTKRTLTEIAFAVFFMVTSSASGQLAHQYEKHLKVLEPFVGVWEGKYDPPGDAPMGTVRVESTWIGNKAYLQVRGLYRPDGVDDIQVNPTTFVFGYDEKAKSLYAWHFGIGGISQGPVKVLDDRLEAVVVRREADEKMPGRFKATLKLSDPDEITIVNTDRIATGGKKQADDPPLVAKRIKSE